MSELFLKENRPKVNHQIRGFKNLTTDTTIGIGLVSVVSSCQILNKRNVSFHRR